MDVYEARRLLVLDLVKAKFEGHQAKFAEATGIPPSYVSRMLSPSHAKSHKRIGEDIARKIEDKLGLVADTLLAPILPSNEEEKPSVYQDVSYTPDKLPLLTREQVMVRADDLTGEFWVDLWDEAIGSEIPKGTRTLWNAELSASPEVGDFVLMKTPDGRVHVRVYAESLADGWQGKALHPDFEAIPAGPGVKVIAVFLSAKLRRSQQRR